MSLGQRQGLVNALNAGKTNDLDAMFELFGIRQDLGF